MVIGEFAIFPTSEGTSVSRYVREAVRALEASGLRTETGGMSTVIEAPDLESLLRAVAAAHAAVKAMGPQRIHIDLRIDHRLDKEATVASKLKAIRKRESERQD
jgi:uncharacterized protein (TIGR00106 family)